MIRVLAALLVGLALLAGTADARLTVNNLSSFGARSVAAAGGVTYQAAAAYVDTATNGANGAFEWTFAATHTKDPDTDFILVAIGLSGSSLETAWPTPTTGLTITYCGSAMTYVTASEAQSAPSSFTNNVQTTWWWLRGPSSGACIIQANVEGAGAGGMGNNSAEPDNITFGVEEYTGVKSSGTPYENVNTAATTGTTGAISLTATLGRLAVWASNHDGDFTLNGAMPSVDFGTVDANLGNLNTHHVDVGHYDASGSKTITLTWGSSVSRNAALSGLHLLP